MKIKSLLMASNGDTSYAPEEHRTFAINFSLCRALIDLITNMLLYRIPCSSFYSFYNNLQSLFNTNSIQL